MKQLVRVDMGHAIAGLIFEKGVVISAAPILKFMKGWDKQSCRNYFNAKGYKARYLKGEK